jgi:hypothetical protein
MILYAPDTSTSWHCKLALQTGIAILYSVYSCPHFSSLYVAKIISKPRREPFFLQFPVFYDVLYVQEQPRLLHKEVFCGTGVYRGKEVSVFIYASLYLISTQRMISFYHSPLLNFHYFTFVTQATAFHNQSIPPFCSPCLPSLPTSFTKMTSLVTRTHS